MAGNVVVWDEFDSDSSTGAERDEELLISHVAGGADWLVAAVCCLKIALAAERLQCTITQGLKLLGCMDMPVLWIVPCNTDKDIGLGDVLGLQCGVVVFAQHTAPPQDCRGRHRRRLRGQHNLPHEEPVVFGMERLVRPVEVLQRDLVTVAG